MKQKLLFLGGIILLVILVAVILKFLVSGRTPKQGILKVTTNVAARVLLDNREIGKTPLEEKVNQGEYTLRLVPENTSTSYASWQGSIKIGSNVLTYVNRDLSESELTSAGEVLWLEKTTGNKAELTVLSVPDGGSVLLNDQSKGVTPISLTDIAQGDQTLLVTSPGFDPRTIKIKLTNGYKLTASISLALSPAQLAQPVVEKTQESTPSATPKVSSTPSPTSTIKLTPTPTSKVSPTPTKKVSAANVKKVKILDTPTGFLRVRKDPSTSAEEVGRVKPGETYAVLSSQEGWYKITFTETTDGWISSQYAEATN